MSHPDVSAAMNGWSLGGPATFHTPIHWGSNPDLLAGLYVIEFSLQLLHLPHLLLV